MEVAQQEILNAPAKEIVNITGSAAVLEALIAEGVDTIFGIRAGHYAYL